MVGLEALIQVVGAVQADLVVVVVVALVLVVLGQAAWVGA